jgi:type I phosphodiesterase/nucleotide pyrophosphatase
VINKLKVAAMGLSLALLVAPEANSQHINQRNGVRRVLLISIDGMHAVDYLNCVSGDYCPSLAALGKTGVNYLRTSTSKPSDSFPGLMALVTGGTPRLVGAFYDVAFDRVLAPPLNDTGNGVFSGPCIPNTPNGTTTEYEEGVDLNQTMLNGGGPYPPTDGGILSIDPTRLPRDPYNNCSPVYPWNFIRANTIYGVIHAAGGYTAWADKHPVYAAVSGPSNNANNVDDYYSPEVNSTVVALPGVTTSTGISCDPIRDPTQTGSWTDSFLNIQCNDQLKVNAILNEIDGKTHLGQSSAPVPAIFGMNFQSVSVGQKLIEGGVKGGYTDAAGTVTPSLQVEIVYVDTAIGQMVAELKKQGLLDTTLIIITAKHGQSPIDPNLFKELGNGITTTPADVVAGFLPPPPIGGAPENPNTPPKTVTVTRPPLTAGDMLGPIGPTQDDISLLWLATGADTTGAVNLLETNGTAIGLGQIFYGPSLETMFNAPGLPPNGDPRSPDIIVEPNVGVIYTGSHKKQEEHGGFAHDDTNVMMLFSNPRFEPSTITSFVETVQVAPTILQALGLDPSNLDAVQKQGTQVLPGLPFKQKKD